MKKKANILIVDDEQDAIDIFSRPLIHEYNIVTANSAEEALHRLKESAFHIVMTDVVMPNMDGIELMKQIKLFWPQTSIVMISGKASIETAVKAMKLGAEDFIEKPVEDLDLIKLTIERILKSKWQVEEIERLRTLIDQDFLRGKVIGNSILMQQLMEKIKRVASTDITILLSGETGVGKELFADLVFINSNRKHRKFVAVNCGSLPESLLESVLFGHKKGSFTDAVRDKVGYFQEADGGTLFLDEITETSQSFQVKLLRVLEKGIIRQVGGDKDIEVDVRMIAATNKDIEMEVNRKAFREDLFYRLNVFHLHIPPLRDRIDDIILLANEFVNQFSIKYNKKVVLSDPVKSILVQAEWKGNVRELKNTIEHAVALAMHDKILPQDLPGTILNTKNTYINSLSPLLELPFNKAKHEFEKMYFIDMLKKNQGRIQLISEKTEIGSQNLYKKFNKYEIDPNDFRE
jgi:DNA-binding NtrC family response regulator